MSYKQYGPSSCNIEMVLSPAVSGHKDECFAWFASTFIPGAGIVDGEIIETLWEPLNPIVPSARKASSEHHWEIVDDHMNHSNWKTLTHMGEHPSVELSHGLIGLSGPSTGQIPCCNHRAGEGGGCTAIYWIKILTELSGWVEDSRRRCTSQQRSGYKFNGHLWFEGFKR